MTMDYRTSSPQSVEQSLEQAKRSRMEFNTSITDCASAVVRYAANLRPVSDPQTLLAMISASFETTALEIISHIDQHGRIGMRSPTQQSQTELEAWRRVALASTSGQQTGQGRQRNRNRSPNRQFSLT